MYTLSQKEKSLLELMDMAVGAKSGFTWKSLTVSYSDPPKSINNGNFKTFSIGSGKFKTGYITEDWFGRLCSIASLMSETKPIIAQNTTVDSKKVTENPDEDEESEERASFAFCGETFFVSKKVAKSGLKFLGKYNLTVKFIDDTRGYGGEILVNSKDFKAFVEDMKKQLE
jgi:hypothetical protein